MQTKQWSAALVLTGVTVVAFLCPVADAALSRRHEFAADRYANSAGVGPELASALQPFDGSHLSWSGLASRLLAQHPTTQRRIAALARTFK